MQPSDAIIAIIGLGYVGLPLAVEFAKQRKVIGFDVDDKRIQDLKGNFDTTLEISPEELKKAEKLELVSETELLCDCNFYIITVPTPIDENNAPNMQPLKIASQMLSKILKVGDVVVYESTVYPCATEEFCVPLLEKGSGMILNEGFFVGYSPERINPGDKVNTLSKIIKITSGSTPEIANYINEVYKTIIDAGTYLAPSIKVAEAAKVIENTQRDLNIATINEFAKIFNIIGIDTQDVLDAAGTKWNFLKFKPGLVGGHCISVDPYYLTYKAKDIGYHPEVILAGRRINDGMAKYVATQLVKGVSKKNIPIYKAKVLILGITFKGDCPDVRNTKVVDVVRELESFNMVVDVYDGWAKKDEVYQNHRITLIKKIKKNNYDAIMVAVDHSEFKDWGLSKLRSFGREKFLLYDVKHVLKRDEADIRL
jgi:UDP-N-acetyl-D-galactosamine dehydrogenase